MGNVLTLIGAIARKAFGDAPTSSLEELYASAEADRMDFESRYPKALAQKAKMEAENANPSDIDAAFRSALGKWGGSEYRQAYLLQDELGRVAAGLRAEVQAREHEQARLPGGVLRARAEHEEARAQFARHEGSLVAARAQLQELEILATSAATENPPTAKALRAARERVDELQEVVQNARLACKRAEGLEARAWSAHVTELEDAARAKLPALVARMDDAWSEFVAASGEVAAVLNGLAGLPCTEAARAIVPDLLPPWAKAEVLAYWRQGVARELDALAAKASKDGAA